MMRWFGLPGSVLLVTGCAHALANGPVASDSSAHGTGPASSESASPAPRATAGRPRADLLRDNDFRMAFEDVQRLRVAVDFQEMVFGLLRVTVGPGFATVSSARYNLERLYGTYRVASYRSEDTVIELWKDGSKIGEVTSAGVLVGAEFGAPR
jgi:hypothetical protein